MRFLVDQTLSRKVAAELKALVGRLDPHATRDELIAHVAEAARQIRIQDATLVHHAGAGHIGGPEYSDLDASRLLNAALDAGVSVIDTAAPTAPARSIRVGLHPTAMHVSGNALFVTNTFDDSVSVIDTDRDEVVQTIATRPWASAKVGYQPNAVTLTADGHRVIG